MLPLYTPFGVSGAINPYGIQDECLYSSCPFNAHDDYAVSYAYYNDVPTAETYFKRDRVGGSLVRRNKILEEYSIESSHRKMDKRLSSYDYNRYESFSPCFDDSEISAFMNNPEVIRALHVKPQFSCYGICVEVPNWGYTSDDIILPVDVYPLLIPYLQILIYNGVLDGVVPHTDNYAWMQKMNFSVLGNTYWHAWYYTEQTKMTLQTAGYFVHYNISAVAESDSASFTFKTILDAGHMVPTDAPQQAFEMFARFVGVPLPVANNFIPSGSSSSSVYTPFTSGAIIGIVIAVVVTFIISIGATWYMASKGNCQRISVAKMTSSTITANYELATIPS
jgi:hypothetical protein